MKSMRNPYTFLLLTGAVAATALALPQNISAQAQPAALEEVVVTAQRREESLQDVPGAVSALSELDLDRKQVGNVLDLQSSIPNISIAQNTGTPSGARIYLRGIGEDESRATVEPAIAMYVDGVFIGRQIGSLFDLLDIERVEVLRGPQGTLYGRNSNGGAIKLISKKPDPSGYSFNAKLTAGDEGRYDGSVAANFGLTANSALRFSVLSRSRDGLFTTSEGEEVGEWDLEAFRVAYRWAADAVDVQLTFDTLQDDSEPRPFAQTRDTEEAAGDDGDEFTLSGNGDTNVYSSEVEQDGLSLSIAYDFGEHTLQSLTSRRSLEDNLNTIISGFSYIQQTDQSQFSQEFQLTSNYSGPLNWVAGVFYYNEDIDLDFTFFFSPFALKVDTKAWAVFGQGTYDFTPALRLTLGVRYTDEEKDFDGRRLNNDFARDESDSWTNTDVKAALSYDVADNATLYGSYTTGFRSGAWSPDAFGAGTATFLPVDDEHVDAYEAGLRSDWLENRLRLNLTVFFNEYEDYQQSGTTDEGFTRYSVDEVETSGAELEITALPLPGLEVALNVGYLDGEYTDVGGSASRGLTGIGTLDDPATPDVEGITLAERIAIAEGLELKNAPEWNAGLNIVYTLSLNNGLSLSFGTDLAYETESFTLAANPDAVKRDDTFIINGRIALSNDSGGWEVALWGKNLDDEIYYPAASGTGVYPADPRLYGVDLKLRF